MAVIGHEDDQRVLPQAHLVDHGHDFANLFVEGRDERGILAARGRVIGIDLPPLLQPLQRVVGDVERQVEEEGLVFIRLEKRARLPGRELAARAAGCAAPTRLHLARLLVERGFARDSQQAFDRYLNRDTPGHVPANWPTFDEAMAVLRDSGAVAVLAHPHRYRASAGQLRELTAAFAQAGGKALEASMAGMSPNDAERIASLCRRFGLHASMGSDFHDPAVPWNPLGRWLKLAPGLEPVTLLLNPRA